MAMVMAMVLTIEYTVRKFGPDLPTKSCFFKGCPIVQLLKAGRRCEECLPSMLLQQSGVLLIKVDFCHTHHNIIIMIISISSSSTTQLTLKNMRTYVSDFGLCSFATRPMQFCNSCEKELLIFRYRLRLDQSTHIYDNSHTHHYQAHQDDGHSNYGHTFRRRRLY